MVMAVTFNRYGRMYYLDPGHHQPRVGDKVLVPTEDGPEVAECVWAPQWVSEAIGGLPVCEGPATEDDLARDERNRQRRAEARVGPAGARGDRGLSDRSAPAAGVGGADRGHRLGHGGSAAADDHQAEGAAAAQLGWTPQEFASKRLEEIFSPASLDEAVEALQRAEGTGRVSTDVASVVQAAHEGRVDTLFPAGDSPAGGRVDGGPPARAAIQGGWAATPTPLALARARRPRIPATFVPPPEKQQSREGGDLALAERAAAHVPRGQPVDDAQRRLRAVHEIDVPHRVAVDRGIVERRQL